MPKIETWTKTVDDRDQLQYERNDGALVVAIKDGPGDWHAFVSGTLSGRRDLGKGVTKKQAKQRMVRFMRNHKGSGGVEAFGGGGSGGMMGGGGGGGDLDFGL